MAVGNRTDSGPVKGEGQVPSRQGCRSLQVCDRNISHGVAARAPSHALGGVRGSHTPQVSSQPPSGSLGSWWPPQPRRAAVPECHRHVWRGGCSIRAPLLRLLLDRPLGLQIFRATLTQKSSFRRTGIANQAGQHSGKSLWSPYNSRSCSFPVCQHFSKFLKAWFFSNRSQLLNKNLYSKPSLIN